ncbi:hypothetical protein ElyMa_004629100 [Elysia marginata]|uniref:Peptidase S1 domain-containing protein n=1 Tax=Elysia marginata TaxID=1093978 RepID=A0AAV4I2G6_9GAST|nr:hypothetical protein ElyMa_004629100 [Elysia marginata]
MLNIQFPVAIKIINNNKNNNNSRNKVEAAIVVVVVVVEVVVVVVVVAAVVIILVDFINNHNSDDSNIGNNIDDRDCDNILATVVIEDYKCGDGTDIVNDDDDEEEEEEKNYHADRPALEAVNSTDRSQFSYRLRGHAHSGEVDCCVVREKAVMTHACLRGGDYRRAVGR